jgi:hypothetical protein
VNKEIKPTIVCAANRHIITRQVICGARHWDKIMRAQAEVSGTKFVGWEQGFIDQSGRFYDRRDAMIAVKESGQPFDADRNSGPGDLLFSEGLY